MLRMPERNASAKKSGLPDNSTYQYI